MDPWTIGLAGGIAGTIFGIAGGVFGAFRSYQTAVNDAQRRFYLRIFAWLIPVSLIFVLMIWLAALEIVPRWVYWAAMLAWFGLLGPLIVWMNRRLTNLAGDSSPALLPDTQGHATARQKEL